jgi:hypothetical protein
MDDLRKRHSFDNRALTMAGNKACMTRLQKEYKQLLKVREE